jgi:hypothetical protein
MRQPTLIALLATALSSGAALADPTPTTWDPARIAQTVDAARQARQQGDVMTAERLCYTAFETIEDSVVAAYDAYADRLKDTGSAEEPKVRAQALRLAELKASRRDAKQPTSTYLGFAPAEGLQAYAELLRGAREPAAAERMHSLALAYQQEQQAHVQRTLLFRQGKDPRGAC